ncbi:MAG: bcp [Candidatus Saccharibacteria bacterium]|nr:bcp [Candidatus Saccharibacteria bacterium]
MRRKPAPDFDLPDQDGHPRSLKSYRGRWVVLFFYPYDKSLNCIRQSCNFRDEYRTIAQFGNAEVIGINRGSVNNHKNFTEKYNLPFPILSDMGHKITSLYGAWRSNSAKVYDRPFGTRRNTYLIDPDGNIAKEFLSIDPKTHVEEVISALQSLQSSASTKTA